MRTKVDIVDVTASSQGKSSEDFRERFQAAQNKCRVNHDERNSVEIQEFIPGI